MGDERTQLGAWCRKKAKGVSGARAQRMVPQEGGNEKEIKHKCK